MDFLWSSDFWVKTLSLITAVVTLAATVVTYRKSRKEQASPAAPSATTTVVGGASSLKVSFSTGSPRQFWLKLFKIASVFMGVMGILICGVAFYFLAIGGDVATSLVMLLEGVLLSGMAVAFYLKFRKRPEEVKSRVRREMAIDVEGDFNQLFSGCRRALEKIKAELNVVDPDHGRLEGKTKVSFWSFGELVSVNITEQAAGHYNVIIASDSVIPTTFVDYGKNRSNVRAVLHQLMS